MNYNTYCNDCFKDISEEVNMFSCTECGEYLCNDCYENQDGVCEDCIEIIDR